MQPTVSASFPCPVLPENSVRVGLAMLDGIGASSTAMLALLHLLCALTFDRFKTRRRLEIENLYLRHQLNIAMRRAPQRLRLRRADRAFMVWITRLWPNLLARSSAGHDPALASSRVSRILGVGSPAVSRGVRGSVANCASSFDG
jgi:hypothetical protein